MLMVVGKTIAVYNLVKSIFSGAACFYMAGTVKDDFG